MWDELTILWNDLTIDWNDLTWNDLTMERNDRIPRGKGRLFRANFIVYFLLEREILIISASVCYRWCEICLTKGLRVRLYKILLLISLEIL